MTKLDDSEDLWCGSKRKNFCKTFAECALRYNSPGPLGPGTVIQSNSGNLT